MRSSSRLGVREPGEEIVDEPTVELLVPEKKEADGVHHVRTRVRQHPRASTASILPEVAGA
jgi:hypothetical protein